MCPRIEVQQCRTYILHPRPPDVSVVLVADVVRHTSYGARINSNKHHQLPSARNYVNNNTQRRTKQNNACVTPLHSVEMPQKRPTRTNAIGCNGIVVQHSCHTYILHARTPASSICANSAAGAVSPIVMVCIRRAATPTASNTSDHPRRTRVNHASETRNSPPQHSSPTTHATETRPNQPTRSSSQCIHMNHAPPPEQIDCE